MHDLRAQARQQYLQTHGWGEARVEPLAADASFRRYFRLQLQGKRCMLMDAPPPQEDVSPFIAVAEHLTALGQRPPQLFDYDREQGFILLEDLGDQTFTRLLDQGVAESELYQSAVDSLIALHRHPDNQRLAVPSYVRPVIDNEVALLVDWYLPALTGRQLSDAARQGWLDSWAQAFSNLQPLADVLVLRDFHVDNLMRLDDGACALLDFQDALLGSPAYDLASLLEDARRDLPESLRDSLMQRYLEAFPSLSIEQFDQHYRLWAAQRHAKVLGIFLRLWLRDGKAVYLKHIPRVLALFMRRLSDPELQPVKDWLERNLPELGQSLPAVDQLNERYHASTIG